MSRGVMSIALALLQFSAFDGLRAQLSSPASQQDTAVTTSMLREVSPNNARLEGAILDGSADDLARLQKIYDATPSGGTIELSIGKWPANENGWALPIEKKIPGKRVLWRFLGPVDVSSKGGVGINPLQSVGDGDLTESFGGGNLTFARSLFTGADERNPGILINLENHNNAFRPFSHGSGPNIPAVMVNATSFPGSTGQLNGIFVNLNSGGNNPYTSEEQGLNIIVNKTGQNSTWQLSGLTLDTTGIAPKAFASIGQELDIVGNGPDDPASLYDGSKGNRVLAYYNIGPYPFPSYAADTDYAAGAKVTATPAGGVKTVFIAAKGGTSGRAPPIWTTNGQVSDNTVTWAYGEPFDVTVGRGIWFDGDKDSARQFNVKYSTLFSSNATIENAAIDLSETLLDHSFSAAIRLASNEPIDFSGDGTAAGQNQRILDYSRQGGALTYVIRGNIAMSIADDGLASFPGQIQAPLQTPKSSSSPCVTGTRTADANYEYVCVATDTWKRTALSNF